MACDCISEMDELLAEHNTRLAVQFLFRERGSVARPVVASERVQTGRGTKKPVTVVPNFCPFCGLKYPSKREDEAATAPDVPEGWEGIGTAPTDGTRIRVGHELDPSSLKPDTVFVTTGVYVADDWQCSAGFTCSDGFLRWKPTHWMPKTTTSVPS